MLQSRLLRRLVVAAACVVILVTRNYNLVDHFIMHSETLNRNYDGRPEAFKQYHVASAVAAAPALHSEKVDWSRFAYMQYVTDTEYLCNSVMMFETLHRLGSLADRAMMYPDHMLDPSVTKGESKNAKLLLKARDEYNVKLLPTSALLRERTADTTWSESHTKLLAFNATRYDRVLSLDSDSLIYQPMDELFLLPRCPVAMPRAYWLQSQNLLSSHLVLLQPSAADFERIAETIEEADRDDYDMEILNELFGDSAMVLPHRQYATSTGEFRRKDHKGYLGTDREPWDPVAAFNEAKYVHFSDWPVPKPWLETPQDVLEKEQPKCHGEGDGADCSDRDIWNGIYSDFRSLRKRVCESGL